MTRSPSMIHDKEVTMRMRKILAVIVGIVALASALGVAANQQIDLSGEDHTTHIDGSQPSFVAHGWIESKEIWQSMGYRNYRSYIHGEGIEFLLKVDDEYLEPTNLAIRFLPKDPDWGPVWRAFWYYRFKPNEFSEGTHKFEGFVTYYNGSMFSFPIRYIEVDYL